VRRGPDWEDGDQDGGPGMLGTVAEEEDGEDEGYCAVHWDRRPEEFFIYRVGAAGKYELEEIVTGTLAMPLQVLFGCASIAKRYLVSGILFRTVAWIKDAICSENFEEAVRSAVALDLRPVLMFCLQLAKTGDDKCPADLRQRYDEGRVDPEIAYELQAIWSPPKGRKRRRIL